MENVNTSLEEIFKTLFPTDGLEPEGFCIDARKLHQALEVKSRFNDWIKQRLKMANFLENIDYSIVTGRTVTISKTGKPVVSLKVDYKLTKSSAIRLLLTETPKPQKASSDSIYLIQNVSTKSIKIGISKDVESRLKSLQTGHEHQLKLIYTKPVEDALELESRLHRKFSNKRVRGEWFKVDPKLVIKEVEELTTKGLAEPLARLQRLALDQLRQKLRGVLHDTGSATL